MTLPTTMKAMVTMGHGDLDQMVLHSDWPRPEPAADEVLIKVGACGLNNTDVNTRSGWYSKTVTDATTGGAFDHVGEDDPTWGGAPITFPLIQGADVCGEIVAVGKDVDPACIGERVITDGWLRDAADLDDINKTGYFGSERDGGFAEYTTTPARNALAEVVHLPELVIVVVDVLPLLTLVDVIDVEFGEAKARQPLVTPVWLQVQELGAVEVSQWHGSGRRWLVSVVSCMC